MDPVQVAGRARVDTRKTWTSTLVAKRYDTQQIITIDVAIELEEEYIYTSHKNSHRVSLSNEIIVSFFAEFPMAAGAENLTTLAVFKPKLVTNFCDSFSFFFFFLACN